MKARFTSWSRRRKLTILATILVLVAASSAQAADSYELVTANSDGTYEWVTWGVDASSTSCKKVHGTSPEPAQGFTSNGQHSWS
jgi:hypothetical protein